MEAKRGDGRERFVGSITAGGWVSYLVVLLLLGAFKLMYDGMWADAGLGLLAALALGFVPAMRWRQTIDIEADHVVWRRWLGTRSIARSELLSARCVRHLERGANYGATGVSTVAFVDRLEVKLRLQSGDELTIVGLAEPERLAERLEGWAAEDNALRIDELERAGGWRAPAPPSPGAR